jgi:hypothetical protein
MLPLFEKVGFKMLKILGKKYMHVYLHILCAHAKFRKKGYFRGFEKERKTNAVKRLILVPNFIIFT